MNRASAVRKNSNPAPTRYCRLLLALTLALAPALLLLRLHHHHTTTETPLIVPLPPRLLLNRLLSFARRRRPLSAPVSLGFRLRLQPMASVRRPILAALSCSSLPGP